MIVVLDIMQTDVVSVTSDINARELARKLAAEDISGAPVIDGGGALVGVVSQTDLVRLAAREQGLDLAVTAAHLDVASGYDEARDPEDDPGELDAHGFFVPDELPFSARSVLEAVPESRFDLTTVEEIMTPAFYSVRPDLPVPRTGGLPGARSHSARRRGRGRPPDRDRHPPSTCSGPSPTAGSAADIPHDRLVLRPQARHGRGGPGRHVASRGADPDVRGPPGAGPPRRPQRAAGRGECGRRRLRLRPGRRWSRPNGRAPTPSASCTGWGWRAPGVSHSGSSSSTCGSTSGTG